MTATGHAPGSAVVGVTLAFTVLAVFITALRIFTRLRIVRNAGVDDVWIFVGTLLSCLLTITMCMQVRHGMSRHYTALNEFDKTRVAQWMWASIWVYYLALGAVKCSILWQYLRIIPHTRFRKACYSMIGVVLIYTCWGALSAVFACTPVAYFWNHTLEGRCMTRLAVWFSNAAFNILTDVVVTILPLPVLSTLSLPKRQKWVLILVFALAGFTCIVSIVRLQSLYAISEARDYTWENPRAAIWSSVEVNVAIICSCLPTMKGLITHWYPRLFSDNHSTPSGASLSNGPQLDFGRGGTTLPTRCTHVPARNTKGRPKGIYELSEVDIEVITVMEQEVQPVEHGAKSSLSESSSMRHLVSD